MTSEAFDQRYKSILKRYFDEPSEKELFDIAAMGRDLVQSSVPIEEVGQIFEQALLLLKKDLPDELPPIDVIERISVPLLELLMAYGLGWREKIASLEKQQEALIEREERLQAIMRNSADGIITIEENGQIESFNPAAERIFGYTAREVIGRNVTMLMPEPYKAEHAGYLANYLRTGRRKIIGIGREVVGRCKDGSTFVMELAVGEMKIGGRISFVGSIRDATERKAAEAELRHAQKMDAMGQLTGGIAHDFNNLMTVVQGNLELMSEDLDEDSDTDKIGLMNDALSAARDGSELAHRLLAFSRKQSLNPTRIDTSKLITVFSRMLRRTIGQDIEVKIDLGDDVAAVLADRSQLENALLNLCLNASHAMPGGGTLSLKTGNRRIEQDESGDFPEVGSGDYVMVTVSDTGTGIPPEILARVFEPFFTTRKAGRGTGLGMSMVQGFANQTGGGIKIESEVGKGTDISLLLPIAPADARTQEVAEESDDLSRGSETVLVVEDEPRIRRFAVRCLTDLGYRVLEAENATAALEILESGASIDLLFSDIIMPRGVTGRELANIVTKSYPGLKVQLASGFNEDVAGEIPKDDMRLPVLKKPYSKEQLGLRIRAVLDAEE